jgi:hypothetical protein
MKRILSTLIMQYLNGKNFKISHIIYLKILREVDKYNKDLVIIEGVTKMG